MIAETVTFWFAVIAYAVSFLTALVGLVFRKEKLVTLSWQL